MSAQAQRNLEEYMVRSRLRDGMAQPSGRQACLPSLEERLLAAALPQDRVCATPAKLLRFQPRPHLPWAQTPCNKITPAHFPQSRTNDVSHR